MELAQIAHYTWYFFSSSLKNLINLANSPNLVNQPNHTHKQQLLINMLTLLQSSKPNMPGILPQSPVAMIIP